MTEQKHDWEYLYQCKDCGETFGRKEVVDDFGLFSCPVCACDVITLERFEK